MTLKYSIQVSVSASDDENQAAAASHFEHRYQAMNDHHPRYHRCLLRILVLIALHLVAITNYLYLTHRMSADEDYREELVLLPLDSYQGGTTDDTQVWNHLPKFYFPKVDHQHTNWIRGSKGGNFMMGRPQKPRPHFDPGSDSVVRHPPPEFQSLALKSNTSHKKKDLPLDVVTVALDDLKDGPEDSKKLTSENNHMRVIHHLRALQEFLDQGNDYDINKNNVYSDILLVVENPKSQPLASNIEELLLSKAQARFGDDRFSEGWKSLIATAPLDWSVLTLQNLLPPLTPESRFYRPKEETLLAASEDSKNWEEDLWTLGLPLYEGSLRAYLVRKSKLPSILGNVQLSSDTVFAANDFLHKEKDCWQWSNKALDFVKDDQLWFNLWRGSSLAVYTWTQTDSDSNPPTKTVAASEIPSLLVITTITIRDTTDLAKHFTWLSTDANELAKIHTKIHGGLPNWQIRVLVVEEDLKSHPLLDATEIAFRDVSITKVAKIDNNLNFQFVSVDSIKASNEVIQNLQQPWSSIRRSLPLFSDFDKILLKDSHHRIAGMSWRTFLEHSKSAVISGPLREDPPVNPICGPTLESDPSTYMGSHAKFGISLDLFRKHKNSNDEVWSLGATNVFANLGDQEVPLLENSLALLDAGFAETFFTKHLEEVNDSQQLDPRLWCDAAQSYLNNAKDGKDSSLLPTSCRLVMVTSTIEPSTIREKNSKLPNMEALAKH